MIYISGKITGLEIQQAESLFENAENALIQQEHEVINPMKIVPYHPDLKWHDYMVEDIRAILEKATKLFMLSNWKDSRGARIEHFIAQELGLEIIYE